MSVFQMLFDGVSRGNPGHAGAAAAVYETKQGYRDCIWFDSEYIGNSKTSNQAEYSALIVGLEYCARQRFANLEICGDSELVIRQLKGEYEVKHKKLIPLYRKARELISSLPCVPKYTWIPREQNQHCDMIANLVVDRELGLTNDDEEDEDLMDNEEDERSECFGFTRDELNTLLSYGMKPWKSNYGDCWDFIQAYKSGAKDENGDELWTRYLGSSSMWDD